MGTFRVASTGIVEGISFSIPELLLVAGWAQFHELCVRIELDWHVGQIEYEEVITLRLPEHSGASYLLWRTADAIVLQPIVGRAQRFATISDALEAICPERL